MRTGCVINFSDRTFAEFFQDVPAIDIYDAKYALGSGSKANRTRASWHIGSDSDVATVLDMLVERCEYEGSLEPKQIEVAKKTISRLRWSNSVLIAPAGPSKSRRLNTRSCFPSLVSKAGM